MLKEEERMVTGMALGTVLVHNCYCILWLTQCQMSGQIKAAVGV